MPAFIAQMIILGIQAFMQYKAEHPDAPDMDTKTKNDLAKAMEQFNKEMATIPKLDLPANVTVNISVDTPVKE